MKSFIKSFFKPTNLHKMQQGIRWEQQNEDGVSTWWIQVSDDIETPKWITMDKFLGEIFQDKIESDRFMDMCIKKYKQPERRIWFRIH